MTKTPAGTEAVVLTVGKELAEKFQKHIHLSTETVARANEKAQELKILLGEGLLADLQQAERHYQSYLSSAKAEDLLQVKRLILSLKSNAGMADQLIVTELAALLFELFDDGYDMSSVKVRESIRLYLATLKDILMQKISTDIPEEVNHLLEHFRELNRQIR